MCARYSLHLDLLELAALFELEEEIEGYRPRYNIAPTDPVLAVSGGRAFWPRWGFRMSRHGARTTLLINARSETVHMLPAFREAFHERRCLVPADGFFEWDDARQPYHIHRSGYRPFALAGTWREAPGGREVCVLTTEPNARIARIHDRMPVMLAEADFDHWLKGPPDELAALFAPYPDEDLDLTRVTRRMGNVRLDRPEGIEAEPNLFDQ